MSPKTIARILSIEQEAVKIHDRAERFATRTIKDAEQAAANLNEQTLSQAHQQAQRIKTTSRKAARAERARIIAQAEVEARRLEELAAPHLNSAVKFVLDQVAGRE